MNSRHHKDTPTIQNQIKFGSSIIEYEVTLRQKKRLTITVHPDMRVSVQSPLGLSNDQILKEVQKRARWIIKQKEFFQQFVPRPPKKRYVSGETFYYLGRQYRLKVEQSPYVYVKLIGRYLRVGTKDRFNTAKVKTSVQRWYNNHARTVFNHRLDICYEAVKRHKIPQPKIQLRRMTKRWGSCGKNTTILLNTELVKAPVHCIDYVIMHELCHFRFYKHDSRFSRLLSLLMPDWQQRKARLEGVCV